ncbi:MAG: helix-turn-helix domain-containing protein [Balneolaceae bacterium]
MASIGRDLASIRKSQGLTIEDLHRTTRIPVHILEAIEDDSIFTDVEENTTYIRSYVRSYARALKIEDKKVLEALDQYEIGNYDGLLLEDKQEQDETGKKDKEDESTQSEAPDSSSTDRPVKEPTAKEGPPISSAKKTDTVRPDESGPPPDVSSVDWAAMGKRFSPLQSQSRIWLGVLLIILVLIGITYFVLSSNAGTTFESSENGDNTGSEQEQADPGLIPDSLQVNFNETPTEAGEETQLTENETLESLPDTLHLVIYAALDKLEPVRVYTDVMDETNPYWIEQGTALRFEFVDSMRIRGQYSRMALIMNGHLVENFRDEFYDSDSRLLEIDRSYFEQDDIWLTPADSLESDTIPQPEEVLDRPSFN